MAQPSDYTPSTDFSQEEASGVSGRSTVRTAALDAELAAIETTLDEILVNLALLQRDDGALLDAVVEISSLSPSVLALLSSTAWTVRGAWVGGTAYVVSDVVLQSSVVYVCIVAHTAGVFATDLAAGDWGVVTANGNASNTSFSPTATLSSTNIQDAVSELDGDLRPTVNVYNKIHFGAL